MAFRSIGDIARHQRLRDSDVFWLTPEAMLTELLADNQELIKCLRDTHEVCDQLITVLSCLWSKELFLMINLKPPVLVRSNQG